MSTTGQSFWSDLRYAARQLRRAPGFALTAILTLAIGIGANAAIFSVVDTVLLRPLGYREANRIFALNTRFTRQNRIHPYIGGDDFVDAAKELHSIDAAAYYSGGFNSGVQLDGHGEYLKITLASRRFGELLGVQPSAGRLFLDNADAPSDALVSSSFARQHFGSVPAALGHVLSAYGETRTISGVLPDGFAFPAGTSVWLEVPDRPLWPARSAYNQQAILHLRPGSKPGDLTAELETLSARLASAYPEDREKTLVAVPLQEQLVGQVRPMLRLLLAAVTVILLIVCANITHLQLVRSTTQGQRMALLNALGASRTRLARLALAQSLVIAVAGGLAGILLGVPLTRLLLHLAPKDLPRIAELQQAGVALNVHVVAVCFLVSSALMLLTAVLPVWRSWHVDPASALKQDASRGMAGGGARLRSALMVGEVALTFVLCVGSALLVQQMQKLSHTELGFQPDHLLLADIHAPSKENDGVNHVLRLETLLDRLRATPGINGAAAVMGAPSQSAVDVGYAIQGRTKFEPGASLPIANVIPVSPEYLKLMKIPLLQGSGLSAQDTAAAPNVAVITRSMQRQSFADRDPIGQELIFGLDENNRGTRIVGVVEDAIQESPAVKPGPTFYVPIAQHPRAATDTQILLRTAADPRTMLDVAAQRIRAFDPAIAVTTSTMTDDLGDSLRTERFRSTLFGSFALMSILLAAIGMYGVTSYAVAQRRFEFALRFAFGARREQVFRGVLRGALLLTAAGLTLGSLAALLLTRVVSSMLTGVTLLAPTPWLIAGTAVLMLMALSTLLPARRAAGVDPMQALRTE